MMIKAGDATACNEDRLDSIEVKTTAARLDDANDDDGGCFN